MMEEIGVSHKPTEHKLVGGVRVKYLIDKGVPFRGGVCLDCYNQQWHYGWHITITARYDDGNKFVTQVCETR